jgi:protocatechuate 3,4-dioxygenase beta subunit
MLKTIWVTLAVLFLLCVPSAAQVASAELSGTVLDPSGAGVPGAAVTATSAETNAAHKVVTEKDGSYFLTQLAPGAYTLTVEANGFRKLVQTGLNLQINQQARLDLTLKVGQVLDTLEVTGQSPLQRRSRHRSVQLSINNWSTNFLSTAVTSSNLPPSAPESTASGTQRQARS